MVAIVVPAVIYGCTSHELKAIDPLIPGIPLSVRIAAGVVLIGCGLTFMIKTNLLFASIGKGTLAPWHPPQKLVVRGIYRHVRNPMITGLLLILLGEAVFGDSLPLLFWFLIFAIANLVYLPAFEEPRLEQRFGQDYARYKQNVPRWIPRLTPWEPENSDKS